MKKSCFIIALIVIALTLHGQQWEIDYGDANSYTVLESGIVNSQGEAIFIGVNGPDRNHYYPMVMRVADDGDYDYIGDFYF